MEATMSFPSVYEIADRPEESVVTIRQVVASGPVNGVIFESLISLLTEPRDNWFKLSSRSRKVLLDRDFVMIKNELPVITNEGNAAMAEAIKLSSINWSNDLNKFRRMLLFIESTVATRSLDEVSMMAQRAGIDILRKGNDSMRMRRMLAAIVDAGKLALVM